MQNKKVVLVVGVSLLLLGVATFIGGALLTRRMNPLALGEEDMMSIIVPAPELPASPPEVTGVFLERQDNNLVVETRSLAASELTNSTTRNQNGPQVEVVITGETMIYHETTQPAEPFSVENQSVQQTVEQATLDDLDPQSMITVWGRKSGDRVVAEVLMYSNMAEIKRAIFEDCEICP
jgi:hypothetical protein